MYDIIVIGAGPAGLSAALYASRAGANVAVIEAGAPGGKLNLTAEIENYPGIKSKSGPDLAFEMYEQGLSYGAELLMAEVTGIEDKGDHKVVHTDSGVYESRAVIIGTGTKERLMNIPGEAEMTGRGISYCAVCDGPFFKGKEVVVVGGGNSAIEEAIYLASVVEHVHVVMRRDVFRADQYLVDKAKANDKITFHFKQKPYEVIIEDDKVTGLRLESAVDGTLSDLPVAAIFPFIGLDPITDFVKDLGIVNDYGYIDVDSNMETSVKGIFAVGDVRSKTLRQVVTAANDGAIAGQYIANALL
ncbi:MAG: thioredoxin-disulfide reductase [Erysipelotrichaceae bacterium]|nr:thioredoxin-disulfide reductase [Erysipelotrichaceae bacterium]